MSLLFNIDNSYIVYVIASGHDYVILILFGLFYFINYSN